MQRIACWLAWLRGLQASGNCSNQSGPFATPIVAQPGIGMQLLVLIYQCNIGIVTKQGSCIFVALSLCICANITLYLCFSRQTTCSRRDDGTGPWCGAPDDWRGLDVIYRGCQWPRWLCSACPSGSKRLPLAQPPSTLPSQKGWGRCGAEWLQLLCPGSQAPELFDPLADCLPQSQTVGQ